MKCRLCGRIFKQLGRHLIKSHDMTPKEYYDLYMKKPYEEYCENPYCINEEENEPNETIFLNLDNGYQRHCCLKCSNQNPTTRLKSENTCIKRYNTINPMKVEKFKNKVSKSLQKTYEDPVKKEDINNRRNQTIKDRYKVKGILSVKELSDKAKKTNLERYGKESYSQTEEFNERITEFSRKVYGVDHFLSSPVILKIKEETNLKKRNVEYNCQDPEVANKISNSLKEFYEDDENRERVNQTKIKHSLERYGTDWPLQNDEVKKKSRETSIINFRKKVAKQMKELNLEIIDDSELIYGTDRIKIRCLKCDKEYINSWYNISLGYGKCK